MPWASLQHGNWIPRKSIPRQPSLLWPSLRSHCYTLIFCISPKFIYWSPHLQYDDIWRWGLWEVIRVRWGHESRALVWWELCPYKKRHQWTLLVAQWLRICLPMQGTRVRALVREDPTCHGATKPVSHNYWACALEPALHNYWSSHA